MKKGDDVIASETKSMGHGESEQHENLRLSPILMLLCNPLVPEFYDSGPPQAPSITGCIQQQANYQLSSS